MFRTVRSYFDGNVAFARSNRSKSLALSPDHICPGLQYFVRILGGRIGRYVYIIAAFSQKKISYDASNKEKTKP